LETTKTTCKNNILFLAVKPRGVLESAGMLPAVKKLFLLVVPVVSNLKNAWMKNRDTPTDAT